MRKMAVIGLLLVLPVLGGCISLGTAAALAGIASGTYCNQYPEECRIIQVEAGHVRE